METGNGWARVALSHCHSGRFFTMGAPPPSRRALLPLHWSRSARVILPPRAAARHGARSPSRGGGSLAHVRVTDEISILSKDFQTRSTFPPRAAARHGARSPRAPPPDTEHGPPAHRVRATQAALRGGASSRRAPRGTHAEGMAHPAEEHAHARAKTKLPLHAAGIASWRRGLLRAATRPARAPLHDLQDHNKEAQGQVEQRYLQLAGK